MKKILFTIILAVVYSSPLFAAGEGSKYVGLQYGLFTYDEDGIDEAEPTALVARIGAFVNDNVAIEGRFGFGLQDDTVNVFNTDVDVEIDNLFGVYGVFHATSNSDASVYGVLGFSKGELSASVGDDSISEDDSGFSYGFGVNIQSFNVEYMRYLDEDTYKVSAISFGFVSEF
jgi:outer membrane immunogenic protein